VLTNTLRTFLNRIIMNPPTNATTDENTAANNGKGSNKVSPHNNPHMIINSLGVFL